jgi:hypothetical protein
MIESDWPSKAERTSVLHFPILVGPELLGPSNTATPVFTGVAAFDGFVIFGQN